MRDQILQDARNVVASCFMPSIRGLWQEALTAYEAGDRAPIAYLFLQELKAYEHVAGKLGRDIESLPEARELKAKLKFLGIPDPDTSVIKGFWEYKLPGE